MPEFHDTFLDGNELIVEAIEKYHSSSSEENLIAILETIRQRMHADGHFILYESYIRIATKVSESAIYGKSIYELSPDSKAAQAYEEFTREFLKDHREKNRDNER